MKFGYWAAAFVVGMVGIAHFQVSADQLRSPCSLEVSWPAELDGVMPSALNELTLYTGQTWERVETGGDIRVSTGLLPDKVIGRAETARRFSRILEATVVIDMSQVEYMYPTVLHELAHTVGYMYHSQDVDSVMNAFSYDNQSVTEADRAELHAIGARCYNGFIFD